MTAKQLDTAFAEAAALLASLVDKDVDPRWYRQAACKDTNTKAFYPGSGQSCEPAKAICAACPVRAECLAEALDQEDDEGVRGGLSARQRRDFRRQHKTPVAPPPPEPTEEERKVARLTAANWSATEIATELGVTPRTVTRMRARIRSRQTAATAAA